MPHHAKASGWTSEGSRMWLHRCDQCGKRRLVDTYFEIYPPLHSKGEEAGWWWACASCLVSIVSDQLEEATKVLRQYEQWEADLIIDDEAWGGNERALPVLTQALLDRLIEIQVPRGDVIHRIVIHRMTATAGGHDEVYGPVILDEHGQPLVAVDHLADDAEELRDRLLEALQA